MATYSTNEFRNGVKVMIDNDPCNILENEFVKPGKGQAFNRVKFRNLKTGRVLERTFRSGETLPGADVSDVEMQYLYNDGTAASFMDPRTYEQVEIDLTILGDSILFIKEGAEADVLFWDPSAGSGQVALSVDIPAKVTLEVLDTAPGVKGNSATNIYKPAKLENGLSIKVPLFIKIGEKIRVDTRTSAYIERVAE